MPFHHQTYAQQITALTEIANAALTSWGIPDPALELVLYANNAVYRVQSTANTYMLRVYRPGHKPHTMIASELAWLRVLHDLQQHAETPIKMPIPAVDHPYTASLPPDTPVEVALFHWIDGESLPVAAYTPQHVHKIGAWLGRFHILSQAHPQLYSLLSARPTLDYDGLFGARSPYNPKDGQQYITPQSQHTLDNVAERVRDVMAAMDHDDHAFGFIHGDFIFKNMLFTPDGAVAAVDFDDCGFGYYLYDMACPLLFYKSLPRYADLKAALWDGYTSVRPLPDHYREHLEVLIAGRYVASCRWVAGNATHPSLRGRATEIINGRAAELREFLRTGVL